MEQLSREVRLALRGLGARPGTSLLAIAALALGIGLTTAMFCIVDGIFLRGLPFERADRLLYVGEQDTRHAARRPRDTPLPDYLEWRAAQRSFEDLAAFTQSGVDVGADGVSPAQYAAARIEPAAFRLLRVAPVLGRPLRDTDAIDGAPPVALISQTAWRRQFDSDAAIVGRTIRINRVPVTVVGVMPAGFGFPHDEDVWLPLVKRTSATRVDAQSVQVFGRLRDGVSIEAANAELAALTARLAARESIPNLTASAVPILDRLISSQVTAALSTMFGAVFGVLLIACVNVTNLLLARAAERVREVSIRLAIGASRARVIRQFLLEGTILAAAGAAAGIPIAYGAVAFFYATMADSSPPFWVDVRVDGRVLLFTSLLAAVAALLSSLAPALRASRVGIFGVLKESGRSTAGLRMVRFSKVLVVAEIVLSFSLLLGSGLLIRSLIAIGRIEIPFRTDLFHARLSFSDKVFADADAVRQATLRLLEYVAAEPGVSGAAATTALPDNTGTEPVAIEGSSAGASVDQRPKVRRVAVSPEFFDVIGIRARQGRLFVAADRAGQPDVAIVSADFAQRYFPDGAPLGRRIQVGSDRTSPWRTIVGVVPRLVVANVTSPSTAPDIVIVPIAQAPSRRFLLLVSSSGDPGAALSAVRRAAARLDPDLPLSQVSTVAQLYYDSSWPTRLFGGVFASFGLAALLLAAAGLYGVMAFGVRSRTQELGVRMALGASPAEIVSMVLRQGAKLIGVGMLLGVGIGGWLGQQMQLFLFAVKPWDPAVFMMIALVLGVAAFAAVIVPAWRAASIDPAIALRDH